ncbi:MAG: formylglycine-generating enzyme family protein, partial [Planctomycetota bacterium]
EAKEARARIEGSKNPEEWEGVIEGFKKAIAIRETPEARAEMAEALARRDLCRALTAEAGGDLDKALKWAESAGAHDAELPELEEYVSALQQKVEETRSQGQKKLQFDRWVKLAKTEEGKGVNFDPETARDCWEMALKFAESEEDQKFVANRIATLSLEVQYRAAMDRGRAAQKQGEMEEAEEAFKEALKLKKRDEAALAALERLKGGGEATPPDPPEETPKTKRERFMALVKAAGRKEREEGEKAQMEALELWRKALELTQDASNRRLVERSIRKIVAVILRREMNAGRQAESRGDWIIALAAYDRALYARPNERFALKARDRMIQKITALSAALGKRFVIPSPGDEKDRHGNPIVMHRGARIDPTSGWPYEIWLKEPRIEMVLVPSGSFDIGSPDSELGRYSEEGPVTPIGMDKPFYMGKYEWTQAAWESAVGNNPSVFQGEAHPVDSVAWKDIKELLEGLNAGARSPLRLPSESEWEYACRAGTTTRFHTGDDDATLEGAAWFEKNSGNRSHPVGRKNPNPWGLYDMHGNLWEWCEDVRHNSYSGVSKDGAARQSGDQDGNRVVRGGSYNYGARDCRAARRNCDAEGKRVSSVGFRIAFTPRR